MSTFAESYDFSSRMVLPVTTHAMSGLGTTPDDYAQLCEGARIGPGLAVRGEEVRSADTDVYAWLRRAGLLRSRATARYRGAFHRLTEPQATWRS